MNAAKPAVKPVPKKAGSKKPTPDTIEPAPKQQGLHKGYLILLVVGLVILAISTALAWGRTLTGWEHTVLTIINGVSLPHWVTSQLAKPLSDAVWGIVGLVVLLLLVPKYRWRAWQYVVAGGSTYVFTAVIEQLVNRDRPAGLTHDVILRASQGGPGFPSGHVAVLAALCATLWVFVSWPWRAVLAALVIAEAWSRIYLGVHTPLDVIGGFSAALVVVAVLHLAPERLRKIFRLS